MFPSGARMLKKRCVCRAVALLRQHELHLTHPLSLMQMWIRVGKVRPKDNVSGKLTVGPEPEEEWICVTAASQVTVIEAAGDEQQRHKAAGDAATAGGTRKHAREPEISDNDVIPQRPRRESGADEDADYDRVALEGGTAAAVVRDAPLHLSRPAPFDGAAAAAAAAAAGLLSAPEKARPCAISGCRMTTLPQRAYSCWGCSSPLHSQCLEGLLSNFGTKAGTPRGYCSLAPPSCSASRPCA